ncbi:MAG: hypothetical protein HQL95_01800 [Magnetococcales bacterium]|nr:hypothetical protein [Magnetococcales bacterium]
MKIKIFPIIDARLEGWAQWYLRMTDGSAGYPVGGSGSILQRMMSQSVGGYSRRDLHAEMSREAQDAVVIESILLDMEGYEEMARNAAVVRERYAGRGTNEQKAARMGMSKDTFKHRLDQGTIWVASAIQKDMRLERKNG